MAGLVPMEMSRCHSFRLRAMSAALACLGVLTLGPACTRAPVAPTPDPSVEYYELLGVVAHHTPKSEADPELSAIWYEIDSILASNPFAEEHGLVDNPAALAQVIPPFVRRIQTLVMRLETVSTRGDDDYVFAAMATGAVYEHFARSIYGMPVPARIEGQSEMQELFRQYLGEHSASVAEQALSGYEACVRRSEDVRAGVCSDRADGLSGLVSLKAEAPPRLASGSPHRAATGPLPEGCGQRSHSFSFSAPTAPPPDYSVAPVLVIETGDIPVEGEQLQELVSTATARIQAHSELPLIDSAQLEKARALVAARKWHEDGPVCGQAPPLMAVLAKTHPHLVLATIDRLTVLGSNEDGGVLGVLAEPRRDKEGSFLRVGFSRPGIAGEEGPEVPALPEGLEAPVDDPNDPRSWLKAATELETPEPIGYLSAVFGSGGLGMPAYLHLSEAEGTDPWLRVGHTLMGERRDDLLACYPGPGVAAFDLHLTISDAGATGEPRVELAATPPGYDGGDEMEAILDRARACIAEVLASTMWQCPRGGEAVDVSVRLCTGMAD